MSHRDSSETVRPDPGPPTRRHFLRSRAGVLAVLEVVLSAAIALYFFLTTFGFTEGMLDNDYAGFDLAAAEAVYQQRTGWLTAVMHVASFLGAGFTFVAVPLLAGFLLVRGRRAEALLVAAATILGLALNLGLKTAIGRPRPTAAPLVEENFASYPSGHAMNALIFYFLIGFLAFHWLRNKLIACGIAALCVLIVLVIGLSRVYLGVHYPTDIMAGYIVGFWWLVLCLAVFRAHRAHHRFVIRASLTSVTDATG